MSDLNHLYERHQVSLYMSENAACDSARRAHLGMADAYGALIETARRQRPVVCVK